MQTEQVGNTIFTVQETYAEDALEQRLAEFVACRLEGKRTEEDRKS